MERYAPKLMELAPRDMVSRAIYQEIRAGRGIDGKDYVYLDLRHLGRKVIEEKLPDITDFARVYQGVEPITEPVPIQPTAHYAMGGIPTDLDARVTRDADEHGRARAVRGGRVRLRVSVHGANRLGTNSLVDLLVFGRRAGPADGRRRRAASSLAGRRPTPQAPVRAEIEAHPSVAPAARRPAAHPRGARRRDDGQRRRLPRRRRGLTRAPRRRSASCATATRNVSVQDKGTVFNTDLLEARELGYLLDCAETTVVVGPRPQGEPRRPRPRGLPGARRRRLPDALAGDQARRRARR